MTEASQVGGDQISVGSISGTQGMAIGQGATAVHIDALGAVGDVITGTKISLVNKEVRERVASNRQASAPPDVYVSRSEAEHELSALLTDDSGSHRIVYLYGLPGMGKTWLARKVATDLESTFVDGTLWGNLRDTNIRTVLWNFIEPYDDSISRGSLTSINDYVAALERALGDKKVLITLDQIDNQPDLSVLLPDNCPNCKFLLVTRQLPPSLHDYEDSYQLAGMTDPEATTLFSSLLRDEDNVSQYDEDLLLKLSKKLDCNPAALGAVASDINLNLTSLEDYLNSLALRHYDGYAARFQLPGLETVVEHLPDAAKVLFPFLGVLGEAPWSEDVLQTVSRRSPQEVAVGLAQLLRAGLVKKRPSGYFQVANTISDFAYSKLIEGSGEQIYKMGLALRISDLLRKGEIMLRYMRQTMLAESLMDEQTRAQIADSIAHNLGAINPVRTGESDKGNMLLTVPIDPLQDFFEDVVLQDARHEKRWLRILEASNFAAVRRQLEDVFDWALDSEDWPLVRRFALRIGVNTTWLMNKAYDGAQHGRHHILFDIAFGLVKGVHVSDADVDRVTLKSTRVKSSSWQDCQFIALKWPGVHIVSSVFKRIDMVGMRMPGAIVTATEFSDVDARYSDFRGVIFQQCEFQKVNLRGAQLDEAKFIDCVFNGVDLRSTALERDIQRFT